MPWPPDRFWWAQQYIKGQCIDANDKIDLRSIRNWEFHISKGWTFFYQWKCSICTSVPHTRILFWEFRKTDRIFWQHSTDHVWSLSSEIDRTDCSRQIQEKIGPLLFTNAFCGLSDNYDVFSEPWLKPALTLCTHWVVHEEITESDVCRPTSSQWTKTLTSSTGQPSFGPDTRAESSPALMHWRRRG